LSGPCASRSPCSGCSGASCRARARWMSSSSWCSWGSWPGSATLRAAASCPARGRSCRASWRSPTSCGRQPPAVSRQLHALLAQIGIELHEHAVDFAVRLVAAVAPRVRKGLRRLECSVLEAVVRPSVLLPRVLHRGFETDAAALEIAALRDRGLRRGLMQLEDEDRAVGELARAPEGRVGGRVDVDAMERAGVAALDALRVRQAQRRADHRPHVVAGRLYELVAVEARAV